MTFDWVEKDGGYRCQIGNITLCVSPDRYAKGFNIKAARGTRWHAQCTNWCERTRTASRYGADVYTDLKDSAREAMRLAEAVYTACC